MHRARTPKQVSEASDPGQVVTIALQNRDSSAALQAKVVDAQMNRDEIYDDPLMPTGLYPLADPGLYPQEKTGSRYPTTPEVRRGPNTGSAYSIPAEKISTPIRPGRDAFIASRVDSTQSGGSSFKGKTPDQSICHPVSAPQLRPVDPNSWKHIEGMPPAILIKPYHDRFLIPDHFGVNSSTPVAGTGTMGVDGVADDHTELEWVAAAPEEPDLELDLTPIHDSKNYRIDPSYRMYAKKTIPMGSVIVQERCLLVLHETIPTFNNPGDKNLWLNQIQGTFQRVGDEGRRYLKALHPPTGGYQVMKETNHYTHHPGGHTNRRYYHVISNVRHSCDPNAELVLNQLDQSVSLKALRKIKKKEEVCVTYAGMDNPRLERIMRIAYSIQCVKECARCTPQGESSNSPSVVDTTQNSDDGAQDSDQQQPDNDARYTNQNSGNHAQNPPPRGNEIEMNKLAGHSESTIQSQNPHGSQSDDQQDPGPPPPNPPNGAQAGAWQTNSSDDETGCCGCGLFKAISNWFREFGNKHGAPRTPTGPGSGPNTHPMNPVVPRVAPADSPYVRAN